MPSVTAAIYIEYSLNPSGTGAALFTGASINACINQCKAIANFKHIDNYQILVYNGISVQYPQPIINQGTI